MSMKCAAVSLCTRWSASELSLFHTPLYCFTYSSHRNEQGNLIEVVGHTLKNGQSLTSLPFDNDKQKLEECWLSISQSHSQSQSVQSWWDLGWKDLPFCCDRCWGKSSGWKWRSWRQRTADRANKQTNIKKKKRLTVLPKIRSKGTH